MSKPGLEPGSASSHMPLTTSSGCYYKPWLIYLAYQNHFLNYSQRQKCKPYVESFDFFFYVKAERDLKGEPHSLVLKIKKMRLGEVR